LKLKRDIYMKQIDMLSNILNGDIKSINTYKSAYRESILDTIFFITPTHVKSMLKSFLNKNISAEELMMWTNFIAYTCIDYVQAPDHDDEDFYCNMWDILHCISSPVIHGGINESTISKYLFELEKEYDL